MDSCLPATGVDPTSMLIVFAVLIVAGGILAALALRKRRGGAAMLLIALPLLAGGFLIAGAPSTAFAATCGPSPTPSAPCVPEEAVADADYFGGLWGVSPDETLAQAKFDAFDVADYVTLRNAIAAIDDGASAEISVYGQQPGEPDDTVIGPIPLTTEQFGIVAGQNVTMPIAKFEAATEGLSSGTVWVEIEFSYDDGCGGTLTTTVTFTGGFDFID